MGAQDYRSNTGNLCRSLKNGEENYGVITGGLNQPTSDATLLGYDPGNVLNNLFLIT